jgi:predicted RNase H-like nuclease (RuvC/YqgF family)
MNVNCKEMSSKEQYRDVLKRDKRIMAELRNEITAKDKTIQNLRQINHQLKNQLAELPKNYKLKKWWQFWK